MITYLVDDKLVDPNGNPVATEPTSPFASFSEPVQTSLADASITTVEAAKALGKAELMKLPEIGEATAEKILAL